ncbi:metallophosphoesterase family protein [Bradyrhizobium sp. LB8.2]|uniref:metallophosphoesterase family protein n=1 Tax=Bradyrhizobium sp. LB8.2 TaxID=3156330 RepID=UPI0033989BD2
MSITFVHCGDIGDPEIITALGRVAPVTAIRGNVVTGEWATEFAETVFVRLAGRLFYVLHASIPCRSIP